MDEMAAMDTCHGILVEYCDGAPFEGKPMTGAWVIGLYADPDTGDAMTVRAPLGLGMNWYAQGGIIDELVERRRRQSGDPDDPDDL